MLSAEVSDFKGQEALIFKMGGRFLGSNKVLKILKLVHVLDIFKGTQVPYCTLETHNALVLINGNFHFSRKFSECVNYIFMVL